MKGDQTPELVEILRSRGIVEAWAGSFEALLFKDTAGVNARLAGLLGMERIVFGSYSPMFYVESALLKLRESALTAAECDLVCSANARRLLPREA
jgi:hypothetical protein